MRRQFALFLLAATILLGCPSVAFANAGIPMIGITLGWMLVCLVPVVFIEGFVIRRVTEAQADRSYSVSAIANVASLLVGVPITWFLLTLIQGATGGGSLIGVETAMQRFLTVTWSAPWLAPDERNLYWIIPSAMMVLLVPYFFVSWLIEHWIARWLLRDVEKVRVRRAVFLANAITYGLMEAVVLGIGVWWVVGRP